MRSAQWMASKDLVTIDGIGLLGDCGHLKKLLYQRTGLSTIYGLAMVSGFVSILVSIGLVICTSLWLCARAIFSAEHISVCDRMIAVVEQFLVPVPNRLGFMLIMICVLMQQEQLPVVVSIIVLGICTGMCCLCAITGLHASPQQWATISPAQRWALVAQVMIIALWCPPVLCIAIAALVAHGMSQPSGEGHLLRHRTDARQPFTLLLIQALRTLTYAAERLFTICSTLLIASLPPLAPASFPLDRASHPPFRFITAPTTPRAPPLA
jgi:hypothetical protein